MMRSFEGDPVAGLVLRMLDTTYLRCGRLCGQQLVYAEVFWGSAVLCSLGYG